MIDPILTERASKMDAPEILKRIAQDGYFIQFVDSPTEEMQLAAIKSGLSYVIDHIKEPTLLAQLTAVRKEGFSLKYINNPPEAVQLAAIANNRLSIKFVDRPTDEMEILAQSGRFIALP